MGHDSNKPIERLGIRKKNASQFLVARVSSRNRSISEDPRNSRTSATLPFFAFALRTFSAALTSVLPFTFLKLKWLPRSFSHHPCGPDDPVRCRRADSELFSNAAHRATFRIKALCLCPIDSEPGASHVIRGALAPEPGNCG